MPGGISVDTLSLPAILKWCAASIAAWWVSTPAAVQALLVLMALDYVSGILVAFSMRELSSEVGRRGLVRKLLTLLLILATHFLVIVTHLVWDLSSVIATAFCVNEVISIAENAARGGVRIPSALLDALGQVKRITGRARGKASGVD